MVWQESQTWRGSESPGGTRNATLAPHTEQKFTGGKDMPRLGRRAPDELRQLVQAADDVIGRDPERVDGRADAVDPERAEAEGLRTARVPAVARDEAYGALRNAQPLDGEPVYRRRGLVDFSGIDAEHASDQAAQARMCHQRSQHRGRAIGEDREPDLRRLERGECAVNLRKGRELAVRSDEPAAALAVQRQAERSAGVAQGGLRHLPEILVAPHQAAQPRVLELLRAPQLAQQQAFSRP